MLPEIAAFLAAQQPPEPQAQVLAEIGRDLELGRYTLQDLREFLADGRRGIATRSWQLRSEMPRILATRREVEARRRLEALAARIGEAGWLASSPADVGRIEAVDLAGTRIRIKWRGHETLAVLLPLGGMRPGRWIPGRDEWLPAARVLTEWRWESEELPLLSEVRSAECGTRSERKAGEG